MAVTREGEINASKEMRAPHEQEPIKPYRYIRTSKPMWLLAENGCWEWQRNLDRNGYGRKKHKGGNFAVHRLMYTRLRGPIPDGLFIDHLCDNKRCGNPSHMRAVTHKENIRRSKRAAINHSIAEQMRLAYSTGLSTRNVGIKFGVSPATAHRVVSRKSWS